MNTWKLLGSTWISRLHDSRTLNNSPTQYRTVHYQ